jgi:predicted nucleic acid-binding protein
LSFLVDASVWGRLAEPQDRFHQQVRDFLVESEATLGALDLTMFEVANAVGVKMYQPQRARWLFDLVAARCADRLVRVDADLLEAAVEIAERNGLTAYDAAYVAAARRNGWQLVSLDLRDLVSKGLAVTPDDADYP